MSFLSLSIASLILALGFLAFSGRRREYAYAASLALSAGASVFLLLHAFLSSGTEGLDWIGSFQLVLRGRIEGFDLVGQAFMAFVFPFLHFFLLRDPERTPFHLFTLLGVQLLVSISAAAGNSFIDFECLAASQLLLYLFLQSTRRYGERELLPHLRRAFLGLALVFFSLVMVYFFRTRGVEGRSYALETWRESREWFFHIGPEWFYLRLREASFFLLYAGTVLLSGLLDFRGTTSRAIAKLSGRAGALYSIVAYSIPSFFFVRFTLGVFPEVLRKYPLAMLGLNGALFLFASLRVGNQPEMKGKLIHFPGIFMALLLLTIPSLEAGAMLGAVFLFFSTQYFFIVELMAIDRPAGPVHADLVSATRKILYGVVLASSLFLPISIAFYGLIEVFLGIRHQSPLLLPIVAAVFFYSWYSIVRFFSSRDRFQAFGFPEATVSILFLLPPLFFGCLPKTSLEPFVQACEEYVKR